MTLNELEQLKARRETGVLIDRLKWAEILDWAIVLTAHHEGRQHPSADVDGWIMHTTEDQPVADDVEVEIYTQEDVEQGYTEVSYLAKNIDWSIKGYRYSVIKYRIVK